VAGVRSPEKRPLVFIGGVIYTLALASLRWPAAEYIRFNAVSIDLVGMTVTRVGKPVRLTDRELKIVEHLLRAHGRVVPHQELWIKACGDQRECAPHTLQGYISNVRRKLERYPEKPSHFVTVRGVGYKFVV